MTPPLDWMPCLRTIGLLALEVTLVLGVAAGLPRCSRSAHWHRTVWQTAISGIFLLMLFELSGVGRGLAAWAWASRQTAASSNKQSEPARHSTAAAQLTPEFRQRVAVQLERLEPAPKTAATTSGDQAQPRRRHAAVASDEASASEPFLGGGGWPWPELVWLIGAVAALAPGLLARIFFLIFHRQQRKTLDGAVLKRVASLARQLGFRRRIRVFEATRLSSPVAFGVLRPSIGLPRDFRSRFSPAQQEVMLAHELAHLAGNDPAWQTLADMVASLLWWHPLVWWARARLRAAAESVADEASLLVRDGPGVLAECLLQLAAATSPLRSPGWIGATGPGCRSGLGRRIERLVSLPKRAWSPMNRLQAGVVKSVVTISLVAAAILCTAWAAPESKETHMKTLKQTWNRSVATMALLAAFNAAPVDQPAQAAAELPHKSKARPAPAVELVPTLNQETLVKDARLLLELGKLDEAESKLRQADQLQSGDRTDLLQVEEKIKEALAQAANDPARQPGRPTAPASPAPAATSPAQATPSVAPAEAQPEEANDAEPQAPSNIYRMDPRLLERYGLKPAAGPAAASKPSARGNRGKQQIENKLTQIILNEVAYDGLPLSEVVRDLSELARRRDPSKQGINFIITSVPDGPAPAPGIDPTTGQPVPAVAADVNGAVVRLHLRDVRLKDVLDAVTRVADQPIKYAVEDYGIVISPAPGQPMGFGVPVLNRPIEQPRLQVRTFRVDTNTFLAGLQNAFGIAVAQDLESADRGLKTSQLRLAQEEADAKGAAQRQRAGTGSDDEVKSEEKAVAQLKEVEAAWAKRVGQTTAGRDVQSALRQLLQQLGISLDVPGKAVFYNALTGIVMVRATAEDLELVQAAIETLGGRALRTGVPPQAALGTPSANTASVVGKVNRPGVVDWSSEQQIDLMEAIARAGGFAPTANKNKIELSRNREKLATYKFEDLKVAQERLWLEPGDVIYVHESFF